MFGKGLHIKNAKVPLFVEMCKNYKKNDIYY